MGGVLNDREGRDTTVFDWLLDADPSIRWQVMRDLTHGPADVIAAERARIATEGWGARLLALQAPDGQWGGSPWSHDWTDTLHVLELLRRLGLDPGSEQARRAVGLVRERVTWRGYGAYQDYYTQFAAAFRGEGPYPVPAGEGIRTLRVLDAAMTSALEGRLVAIEEAA